MDEDVIIPVLLIGVVCFWIGIMLGCNINDITELENECIVYENNVYCIEEAE